MYHLENAIFAVFIAFAAAVLLCPAIIPLLKKIKFGQTIRDDGPKSHAKKAGTPTMGGIIIIVSLLISAVFFLKDNQDGVAVILVTLGYGIIGFFDDYIKIYKKRSLGLRAYQKMFFQIVITVLFAYYLNNYTDVGTEIYIPFTDGIYFDLGVFYWIFLFFVMVGTVNGVNLTDGLDGLASGVSLLVTTFFLFIAFAADSPLTPIAGAGAGALLGFLLFNSYPARVFMGDTGSLALGGFIASFAVLLRMPLLIVIVGFIYV